jgi:hypothetical protein
MTESRIMNVLILLALIAIAAILAWQMVLIQRNHDMEAEAFCKTQFIASGNLAYNYAKQVVEFRQKWC